VAIDGEGIQLGKKQVYAYLADSTGREIWEPDGIPTVRAFDFLLGIPGDSVVVGYGIGYDVEMIRRDLPRKNQRELDKTGKTVWGDYKIRYWPRKMFEVWRQNGGRVTGHVRIDDVLSNFVQSFEEVAKEWLGVEGGVLADGKARRGMFSVNDLEYIRRYTGEELRLLIEAVRKLKDARISSGFTTSNLYSPANLSVELFRRWGVKSAFADLPTGLFGPAYRAFFGGRIEALSYGTREGPVYEFDITSAYPWAMADLPNLANGTWVPVDGFEFRPHVGLYRIRWNFPDGWDAYPFPWRAGNGAIYFPQAGEGYIWAVELFEPMNLSGEFITVLEGWRFEGPGEEERPFGKIAETFQRRAALKAAGDPAEYPLKLALNSAYGKTAQRKGVGGLKPTYHNIAYAGLITARVRAALWAATAETGGVLSFNTDAVFVTEPTALVNVGDRLGEWKAERYDGIQILQSGVYRLKRNGAWLKTRARGFGERNVPWDEIVSAWDRGETTAEVKLKDRFVSHRFADARNRMELGGTWEPVKRRVSIVATGKRADVPGWQACNPAKILRATAPEGIGISEFDLSAPNLPPWETAPQPPRGTRLSRHPESPALSVPVSTSPRGAEV
jgi:hypothetical protein